MRNVRLGFVGALLVLWAGLLTGCASAPGKVDPWEQSNRFFYKMDDTLDKVALKPLADGYVKVVPLPARQCLGNAFDNLDYFNVILNDFLQGKGPQGWSDAGRMALNSTVGIAGLFDVASKVGLPSHENDFGLTLGKWGMEPGPYLVLPLFGPTTCRDAPGIGVAILCDPTTWLGLPLKVWGPLYTVEAIDTRARAERELRFRNAAAIDPYVFTRDAYLQYRRGQIHEGQPPADQSLYDEDAPATGPATGPATPPTTRRGQ